MNNLLVVQDCVVSIPQWPVRSFAANEEVAPNSPFYWPLLWAGLATDTGEPGPEEPVFIPPNLVYAEKPTQDGAQLVWNAALQIWVPDEEADYVQLFEAALA